MPWGAARAVPFKQVASLPLPSGLASVDLSPDRSTLVGVAWYAPFTEGIRVWDTKTLSLIGDHVGSANTNWSVRVGADGQSCWTTQYYDGNVRQVALATGATLQDVPVGQWPGALELDHATGLLYVGQNDSGRHEGGNIVVVDTAGGSAIATLLLVNEPSHDLRLNSDGSLLYVHVRSPGDETLYKIRTADLAVEEIVQTFEATSVGYTPDIAWDAHRGRAYVPSNGPDGAVMVLDYVIPEPATIGLLCVGLLAGLRRRGRARARA